MTNEHVHLSTGKNDECYTHDYAVEPLLEFLEPFRNKIIWCPFDTKDSEFVKIFTKNGYNVEFSHIDNGQDFYKYEPKQFDIIISNPPFTNKTEMFKRIISFNKPFAILMSILYLNDDISYKTFKNIDLQLLMFDKRMNFKNQPQNKINFKSAYFCKDFLPQQIVWRNFSNRNQLKLIWGE